MNEGMRVRSRVLLRARSRAVIAFGVVAGVLAGGLIALATAARETGASLDTYMARLDGPDAGAVFCSLGRRADDPATECFGHNQRDELRRLQTDERVEAAGRIAPTPVLMRRGSERWTPMFAYVSLDELTGFRRPPVIEGTAADLDDPAQVMVNETLAKTHGLAVGDRLDVAPIDWDQFDADRPPDAPTWPAVTTRVTAILRTPDDLQDDAADKLQLNESALFLGPGWVDAVGENDFARYGVVIGMQLRSGTDPDDVIETAAAGQDASRVGALWDVRAFGETVRYDARAAYAAAGIATLAATVFLVQLVARQARRELDDAAPLRALGATPRLLVQSTVARWGASLALAALLGLVVAAALRPLGPIGLGRQLIARPTVSLDPRVTVIAMILLSGIIMGTGLVTTWSAARSVGGRKGLARPAPLPPTGSPTAVAGVALGLTGWSRRWTATTALAVGITVGAAVAAATVFASLHHLASRPERFGASWDMSAASLFGPESTEGAVRSIAALPGVEAVAGLIGNDAMIGDQELYAFAYTPIGDLPEGIAPVMTRGRPPSVPGEVALGASTMERAGVDLGDTVALRYLDRTEELVVVGEAIINDGYEDLPGDGAIVDDQWLREIDAENYPSDVLVRFTPESRETAIQAMEAALPETAVRPIVPGGIRDLQRIDSWLAVLTVFAAALAAVMFAHALMVTVRGQRRQFGVLRAIGFSRRQVQSSVAWLASLVVAAAVVIGVPMGAAVGRWGWGRLADNLGVPSVPVVPPLSVVLAAAVALLAANIIAFPLGWRAARGRPVDELRAE